MIVTRDNEDGTAQARLNYWAEDVTIKVKVPRGLKIQAGSSHIIGYEEGNRQLPFVVGRGNSGSSRPSAPARLLKFWCQSEATHLRNNCAPEACQLLPFTAAGSPIYTYYSKAGSLHDARGRAFGLVSFREGTAARLAVSYPRFNSAGDALEAYRIDILDADGTFVRSIEFATSTVAPFGNAASDQLFLNSENLHFWLTPRFSVDSVRLRAWNDGEAHQLASDSDRDNNYLSCAYEFVLYPRYTIAYSGAIQEDGSGYWPCPISSLLASFTGSIKGLIRAATETLTSWEILPTVICNLPSALISDVAGPGTGWPANFAGRSWTVAVSERALLDGTLPANAALGYGYIPVASETQHNTNLGLFSKTLQLNVAELDAATGARKWIYRITKAATTPITAEGLLTPFESYMASPFGSGPASGVTAIEGRVTENSLSDVTDYFPEGVNAGDGQPLCYPGRTIEGGVTTQGAAFSWPSFQYFRATNIRLFPWRNNDLITTPPSTETSSFYSGCSNNLDKFTKYGLQLDNTGAPCGPGIFRDKSDNIYFAYMFPRGLMVQGRVFYRLEFTEGGPEDGERWDKHLPALDHVWEARQVSLTGAGVLRWEHELTEWMTDAEWYGRTDAEYGTDFIVGGPVGGSVPILGNVPWQVPPDTGKFFLRIREKFANLGSLYRPDLYMEIMDGSTGGVLQTLFLPASVDVLASDRYQDSGSGDVGDTGDIYLARAGERKWYVSDTRLKSAVDSNGVEWCILYLKHATRDLSASPVEQILTYQAPVNGSVNDWTLVGDWTVSSGNDAPTDADWESVVLSDGVIYWNHWDGSAWKVYSKTL